MKTQNQRIKTDLLKGMKITPLDALHRYGCFRLSARIYDLRQEGMAIEGKMVRKGQDRYVKQYYLKETEE